MMAFLLRWEICTHLRKDWSGLWEVLKVRDPGGTKQL